jgi:hypothetical protein
MKKELSVEERLRILRKPAQLIADGNAGLDKDGNFVDIRESKFVKRIPSHLYRAVRHFLKDCP